MQVLDSRLWDSSTRTNLSSRPSLVVRSASTSPQQLQRILLQADPCSAFRAKAQAQRQEQRQSEQQQAAQDVPWHNMKHPEELREILGLPPFRFQTLIHQEPSILGYQADTLRDTLEALAAALHTNHTTLIRVLEQRPGMLVVEYYCKTA